MTDRDPGPLEARRKPAPAPQPPESLARPPGVDSVCPVCGGPLETQKCKVVCARCRLVVLSCSEF